MSRLRFILICCFLFIIVIFFTPTNTTATTGEITPRVYLEVNIPATELTVYSNDVPVIVKRIAIGQGIYPTPVQESQIKKIEWNPWWYPPKSEWAKNEKPTPPGPKNPLGPVKLPISDEILFHGTNASSSVGRPASHGCMRMLNTDAIEVAWFLQSRFSEKSDPAFRDLYRNNSRTTYVVKLGLPVPVKLVYRPVVMRGDKLVFYPDHYNKLGGFSGKKLAIIFEIIRNDTILAGFLDNQKIEELAKRWPSRATEISVKTLLREPVVTRLPHGPECS